ncbi:MAG: protein translocase subunit SecF [Nanoarchaeota archaeon]
MEEHREESEINDKSTGQPMEKTEKRQEERSEEKPETTELQENEQENELDEQEIEVMAYSEKKPLSKDEEKPAEKKEKPVKEATYELKKELKKPNIGKKIRHIYDKQYKKLLIIPVSMLIIALILIIFQIANTGDFVNKDVSLKGGVTITIPDIVGIDTAKLGQDLSSDFQGKDMDIRYLKKGGSQSGLIITSDIDGTKKQELDSFILSIEKSLDKELADGEYSVEVIGSSLGESFFKEIIRALIIAFIFMGIVVFLYFRVVVPSIAVILAAFSDIVITLAIVNLMGLKLSTAGIAAFLMLIGYSVDTDILLSTRVLKRKEGKTIMGSIYSAMKTGMMMTLTTAAVIIIALFFTESEVIRQIMIILIIGLGVDIINTWIENTAILRMYLEKKNG